MELPDTLVTIGVSAFSGCECLEGVKIPVSVRYIYDSAFDHLGAKRNDCGYLDMQEGVRYIGKLAFYFANIGKDIIIPKTVRYIGRCGMMPYYNKKQTNVIYILNPDCIVAGGTENSFSISISLQFPV